MNYLISLMFDGSFYHGWQRQSNALSVQECVENACEKLFGEKITVNGCSRTDTGVHANCFMCSFNAEKVLPHKNVVSGLNFFLPQTISVTSSTQAADDFHARFSCKSKEYIYKIYTSKTRNPFYLNKALLYFGSLEPDFLNAQAQQFLGTHDFSAFRSAGSDTLSAVRTVLNAAVYRDGEMVIFKVEADGFLYNMVRIMTGTLLYISEGKIKTDSIPGIIASQNRLNAGVTAPPHGLYLNAVHY